MNDQVKSSLGPSARSGTLFSAIPAPKRAESGPSEKCPGRKQLIPRQAGVMDKKKPEERSGKNSKERKDITGAPDPAALRPSWNHGLCEPINAFHLSFELFSTVFLTLLCEEDS